MTSRNSWIGVFVALAMTLCTPPGYAQGVAGERELKAAIVYKLAKFVQRPERRPADRYTIGVIGDVEMARALEKTVRNRTVAGARVEVRQFEQAAKVSGCDVVFLPAANESQRDGAIEVQAKGVLVVSDLEGFAKSGGIVEMKRVRSRIRFVVNPDAAEAAGLELSSTLVRLAEVVRGVAKKTESPPKPEVSEPGVKPRPGGSATEKSEAGKSGGEPERSN